MQQDTWFEAARWTVYAFGLLLAYLLLARPLLKMLRQLTDRQLREYQQPEALELKPDPLMDGADLRAARQAQLSAAPQPAALAAAAGAGASRWCRCWKTTICRRPVPASTSWSTT